jgi:hypothetical protein
VKHEPALGSIKGQGFIPMGAVTGIGRLPMADPSEASDFVGSLCPVTPFAHSRRRPTQ